MITYPLSDAYAQARLALPNMPEEVFALWFDGRIQANGWPPISDTWSGTLRYLPLSRWANLHWSLETVTLQFDMLTPQTQQIVEGLIAANFHGAQNIYRHGVSDSLQRIASALFFITEHRALPGKLIFLDSGPQYEIVDGCHRLAAYFESRRNGVSEEGLSSEVAAWVGREQY